MHIRDIPPKRLLQHRDALVAFHNAYQAYLDAEFGNGNFSSAEKFRLRNEVIAKMPKAHRALNLAGVGVAFTPPPAFAGRIPIMDGLANTAFLHEEPGWRLESMAGIKPTYAVVLENLRLAAHTLEDEIEEARRRRRNPLYWIDRGLRAVLGFPAYLLSLVLPFSREEIDESGFGTVLKLVPLIGLAFAIYFGGAERGWWQSAGAALIAVSALVGTTTFRATALRWHARYRGDNKVSIEEATAVLGLLAMLEGRRAEPAAQALADLLDSSDALAGGRGVGSVVRQRGVRQRVVIQESKRSQLRSLTRAPN